MKKPRVILADDHVVLAEGLKRLLAGEFELAEVVDNGRDLVAAVRRLEPDAVVVDISMPHMNGLEAIARIARESPNVAVVVLTMHQNVTYARRALEAGASGYVLKHCAPEELVMAIHAALRGRTFITPAIAGEMVGPVNHATEAEAVTPRQREILQLIAEGRSAKQIAEQLAISPRTVEYHKYHMMERHGLHSSAELIHFAIKRGIVAV